MTEEHPTDDATRPPSEPAEHAEHTEEDIGVDERSDEGMAPLVTNTGDDDDGAPTG